MPTPDSPTILSRPKPDRFDLFLAGTIAALAIATAVIYLSSLRLWIFAPALDHTLDDIALLVTTAVTVQSAFRYAERRETIAFYRAIAFLVLMLAYLAAAATSIWVAPGLGEAGQGELYVWHVARLVASMLLAVGGFIALSGRRPIHSRLIVAGSLAAVLAIGVAVALDMPLPSLVEGSGDLQRNTLVGAALPLLIAVFFGVAAWVSWRLWKAQGTNADRYITLGLVLAAFAQVHAAIYPGSHPGPVSSAEFLRLGFYLTMLLAIEIEVVQVLGSLRSARQALEDLRQSELDRAALEERARLSRELHDGLAQSLWLAKLRVVRLLALPRLSKSVRELATETADAIEMGLNEARQAVMATRLASRDDASFESLLERYVNDYADRFGIAVAFDVSGTIPQLAARTQAELLRIAMEALANVHRHAGASQVTVTARVDGDQIALSVADDGRGFNPDEVADQRFGIYSMRERASLIGGKLNLSSAPGSGTRVEVKAPVALSGALLSALSAPIGAR